jgi:hypothetical protein
MQTSLVLTAGAAAALLVPAAAQGATLATNAPCYVEGQSMGITGTGWAPGSAWGVSSEGIAASGTTGAEGSFAVPGARAPEVFADTFKPQTFTLTGTQDGEAVATKDFQVVNFLVRPRSTSGKPTRKTTWVFSGFESRKRIYFHIKRGRRVYTQRIGRTKSPCGTLKKRMRRLPAVPASQIRDGRYKVFIDHRRGFKRGGYQYGPATITIF